MRSAPAHNQLESSEMHMIGGPTCDGASAGFSAKALLLSASETARQRRYSSLLQSHNRQHPQHHTSDWPARQMRRSIMRQAKLPAANHREAASLT
jgi:hypothetical protein